MEHRILSVMHFSVRWKTSYRHMWPLLPSESACLNVIIFPSCHLQWFPLRQTSPPSETTGQSMPTLCWKTNKRALEFSGTFISHASICREETPQTPSACGIYIVFHVVYYATEIAILWMIPVQLTTDTLLIVSFSCISILMWIRSIQLLRHTSPSNYKL